MKVGSHFAVAVALLAAATAHAQQSLCTPDEHVIWSCTARQKTFSICASSDLSGSKGYMQYRAGSKANRELTFPKDFLHPKGIFTHQLLARGAILSFENEGFVYTISEPLAGRTTIGVTNRGRSVATIDCGNSTETLTLTTTIDRLREVGIHE